MCKVEIIADSVNPAGKRLTTYVLEYQRFIHAELLTHRCFSKNAASSRAIPIEKIIESIQTNPAMPVKWGSHKSGMQSGEELDDVVRKEYAHGYLPSEYDDKHSRDEYSPNGEFKTSIYNLTDKEEVKIKWLEARDSAIEYAQQLNKLGLHKSLTNRILEPWFNIRIILSGTEFENFFALRVHPDAQPEIQELARQMLELYNSSTPKQLKAGEWHLPFDNSFDQEKLDDLEVKIYGEPSPNSYRWYQQNELKKKICVARCARISYFNFEGKDDYEADIKLCDRLFGSVPRHLSPTEHVAQATDNKDFIGNFSGFKQYRYFFADQNLSDPRVIKK